MLHFDFTIRMQSAAYWRSSGLSLLCPILGN